MVGPLKSEFTDALVSQSYFKANLLKEGNECDEKALI